MQKQLTDRKEKEFQITLFCEYFFRFQITFQGVHAFRQVEVSSDVQKALCPQAKSGLGYIFTQQQKYLYDLTSN